MTERPSDWPDHVQPVTLADLKRLGTDGRNQLYWDGKIVRSKLRLSMPQTFIAALAVVASVTTIFTGLNNGSIFLCARGIGLLGCPKAQSLAPPPVAEPPPRAEPPVVRTPLPVVR